MIFFRKSILLSQQQGRIIVETIPKVVARLPFPIADEDVLDLIRHCRNNHHIDIEIGIVLPQKQKQEAGS